MLTYLFFIGLCVFFVKSGIFAFKAAWGITKIALVVFFFPAILVVLFCWGLIYVAFPIMLIALIVSFIVKPAV